jgi:hypothetical protein
MGESIVNDVKETAEIARESRHFQADIETEDLDFVRHTKSNTQERPTHVRHGCVGMRL